MKKHLLILISLMMMGSNAFANNRIGILGGIDYNLNSTSVTVLTTTATVKGGLGFGGGLIFDLGVFEIGGIFLSKKTTTTVTGIPDVSTTTTGVEIPVMYRFGGNTSFGLGGFYDVGSTSNYGLTAGPRFASAGGLFIDLRFNYGLKTGNSKDLLAMVGYYFGK